MNYLPPLRPPPEDLPPPDDLPPPPEDRIDPEDLLLPPLLLIEPLLLEDEEPRRADERDLLREDDGRAELFLLLLLLFTEFLEFVLPDLVKVLFRVERERVMFELNLEERLLDLAFRLVILLLERRLEIFESLLLFKF